MQRTFHEVALPVHCFHTSCGIVVLWREENRNTQGENPLGTTTRTNNKLHSHVTAGPGIKPHP